jgi:Fe(3+) dicitrate transport protein
MLYSHAAARAALLASVAFLPVPAFGQDATAEDQTTLEEISITGNWLDQPNAKKVLQHPGARTIIDRKEFEARGAQDVRDALNQIPGVQVQESNGTGGSDVSLNLGVRGLTSRLSPRSTVLVDGIPLSYAPYGQPQLSLFPLVLGNVDTIDVVRGAGSVRYGPQNVGGIINFVTRPIPETATAQFSSGMEVTGRNGNAKTTPSFFAGGTSENGFGGAILYSGIHGDGFRDANESSNVDDLILKGKYDFSDTDSVNVQYHHYSGKGDMPGGLTREQFADNPYQSTRENDFFKGRRDEISARYKHDDGVNSFELLSYYVDSFRTSQVDQAGTGADAGSFRLTGAPRNYKYFGIEPRYSRLFELGGLTHEVTVGYRYLWEDSSEVAQRSNFTDRTLRTNQTSEGGTKANAVYVDDKIKIGNWTITPGVRYEMIDTHNTVTDFNTSTGLATGRRSPKIDSNEALPTLSAAYQINDGWTVFANAGVSFGPQQYSQLASTTDGLSPEKAKTYEVGTHYETGRWSAELTAFYIDFDKELYLSRVDGGVGIWTNLGATRHRGVEAAARYDLSEISPILEGLSVYANYTYTEATFQAGEFKGRDLPFYSRHFGTLGARYQYRDWAFNADILAQSKQRSPGNPDPGASYVTDESANGRLGDIPGYAIFNVRAAYQPQGLRYSPKVGFGVKNLFDKTYFTRSSDNNGGKFVGQPRTFFVNTSVAF